MKDKPVKTRRKFDETSKREAVQSWLQSGKSAEVIAEELGLKANQLYAWKKAFSLGARVFRRRSGQRLAPRPIFNRNWTPPGAKSSASVSSATF